MRARNIKPGICDNELLGTADPFLTLLFERLWMIADREGRLEDRPLRIKAQAFPYRDGLDTEPMLRWLAEHEFIARYESGGQRYIQILKFGKHQSPHKNEQASVIPSMDEQSTTKAVLEHNQGSSMDALIPDSGFLIPDSQSLIADLPNSIQERAAPKAEPLPEGLMATALRDRGVTITSQSPILLAWLKDGFTTQQALEATELARMRKPWPEKIPPAYLDAILRQPQRGPPSIVTPIKPVKYRTADEIEAEERTRGASVQ